ncbi:putative quinol monooxygenase [Micromonospora sp. NPDC006431]|uniref:putative quinol monooxygenase n=1 Tax=Micromonospora sp. NPDC006431 TaxID=3364235 RepID=UPI0036BF8049
MCGRPRTSPDHAAARPSRWSKSTSRTRNVPVRDGVPPGRKRPGLPPYQPLKNNPAAFYVLGNWADEQALDAHLASTHVRQCLTETVAGEIVAPYTQWRMQMLSEPDTRLDRPRPVGNSPAQVTLVPFFTIKADEEAAVGDCHLEMVAITRAEPGCLGYDLYQSVEDPSVMFLYENWTEQAALDKHMNTSNFYRTCGARSTNASSPRGPRT